MAPIAISPATKNEGSIAQIKTSLADPQRALPDHGVPVKPDCMYKFKYQHELPVHSADILAIANDIDAKSVAGDFVSKLGSALSRGDAQAFCDLFLDFGVWRDRSAFTWEYRSFNFKDAILRAAKDILPRTPVSNLTLMDPPPTVERPYKDVSFIQAHVSLETDVLGASGLLTLVNTPAGYRIWWLNTVIESLHGFPEIPERDGHMTGPHSWENQRQIDLELEGEEPEVLIIGGGQNGLMTAARLKALGVSALVVERNSRIGDNWRGRYEALSLHLPHWADHFAYMPYPRHWPMYCPAGKIADWFEWYVSALELNVWTSASVTHASQDSLGRWTVEVTRDGKKRDFKPKQLVLATSLAGVPYSPTIPGREIFTGTVRHSTEHDSSRAWVGKRVLVVGTSSSGFDTAYDFARRGVDVTLLQRSPTYIMSLTNSVPRILGLYKPDEQTGKRPDLEVADRIAYGTPLGPMEEMGKRLGKELTELDHDLLDKMESRGFKTWRGQRSTSTQTLGFTKNGGFYFDAGACEQIINGNIKVEQGYIDHFTQNEVVLNGDRHEQYDLVVLATGFSNTIDSVRAILGEDLAQKFKPIWGMDEEGELNAAWKTDVGLPNTFLMVGTLQAARYHSQKVALRIKAKLEGIDVKPYTG